MRIALTTILVFLFFTLPFQGASQDDLKFGILSDEEKTIMETPLDPEADAIILADYGELYFNRGDIDMVVHMRIKILNTNALDEANITLPFVAFENRELIYRIAAHTMNVDEEGNVTKSEVKKSDYFLVDVNEKVMELRFAFPNVKPGSIIEYRYRKKSKNYVSQEWRLQNRLPTLKSSLYTGISAGLDYNLVYNGVRLVDKYKGGESRNNWALENVPPLKDESFCMNPGDYSESIKFQLAGYETLKRGRTKYVEMMASWKQLNKELLETESFEKILNSKRLANKLVKKIISTEDTPEEKVKKIYTYVQKKLEWDGMYRLFPDLSFDEISKTKIVSSAEINIYLVRLLQSAGFDSSPVIISTKDNGLVTKVYPLYTQFNHVIAQVTLDGKDVLMDAVSKIRPYNLLGIQDLNHDGYLIDEFQPRWIEIPYPKRTKNLMINEIRFTEEQMKFKISFSFYGHEAAGYRAAFNDEEIKDEFVTKYLIPDAAEEEMELDSFKVKNEEILEKPFYITCYFTKEMEEEMGTEIIYINPFLSKHFEKNPFSKPERYLPIDFILPSVEKFITNVHFPKDYELAEEPKNIKMIIPSEKISYSFFNNQPYKGMMQISSEFVITQPMIENTEYPALQDFFNQLMGLQDHIMVLKRK